MPSSVAAYRDPENTAFPHEGTWYRVASRSSAAALDRLRASQVHDELVRSGRLVAFEPVEGARAGDVLAAFARAAPRPVAEGTRVYAVESVAPLTYPWEWPDSLLRAAGRVTLEVREVLLDVGLDLKDASAFNVQFRGATPVFVDLGSVEVWRPNPSWNALRQFVEHFVNPLAVGSSPLVSAADAWELGQRRGLGSRVARGLLPRSQRRRPGLWLLQASTVPSARAGSVESRVGGTRDVDATLALRATRTVSRRLQRQLDRFGDDAHRTTWSDYSGRDHYGADDLARKQARSRDFVAAEAGRERLVLDVGGNDGLIAEGLIRELGAHVVVADMDAGALDVLCARAASDPVLTGSLLPLRTDLTNLTWDSGLLGREHSAFVARMRPSAVICQAVLHHVVITQGVPMRSAVEALAAFGAPVQIEFAREDDAKVDLLRSRIPNWSGVYDAATLLDALEERFDVVRVVGETSATRVVVEALGPRTP